MKNRKVIKDWISDLIGNRQTMLIIGGDFN